MLFLVVGGDKVWCEWREVEVGICMYVCMYGVWSMDGLCRVSRVSIFELSWGFIEQ